MSARQYTRYIHHSLLGMIVWQTPSSNHAAVMHSTMMNLLNQKCEGRALSAGYVVRGECVGNSESLGIKSDPLDTVRLRAAFTSGMPI